MYLVLYLFNFFVNNLIKKCLELNVCAFISGKNVNFIGYCDDIMLMANSRYDMEKLFNTCHLSAKQMKMESNPKKSSYVTFGQKMQVSKICVNGVEVPYTSEFIYLGLPIGDELTKKDFIDISIYYNIPFNSFKQLNIYSVINLYQKFLFRKYYFRIDYTIFLLDN